jgi:hypothetical protein
VQGQNLTPVSTNLRRNKHYFTLERTIEVSETVINYDGAGTRPTRTTKEPRLAEYVVSMRMLVRACEHTER